MLGGFYFAELMILDTVNDVHKQMQVPKMVHRSKENPNPEVTRRCNSITERDIWDPGLSLLHGWDGEGGKLDSMEQVHSSQQWWNHAFKNARQDKIMPTSQFTFKPKKMQFSRLCPRQQCHRYIYIICYLASSTSISNKSITIGVCTGSWEDNHSCTHHNIPYEAVY